MLVRKASTVTAMFCAGMLLAALSTTAAAKKSAGHTAVDFDPADFAAQRSAIEQDIRKGERYAEIGQQRKRDVLDKLDSIERILEDVQTLEDLKPDEKAELFNLQGAVNTLLTGAADDSRLVCKRETKTGSHRQVTVCRTVAKIRQEREEWQKVMRDVQRAKLPESN